MGEAPSIGALIKLGRKVLDQESQSDLFLDLLDRYTESLEIWLRNNPDQSAGTTGPEDVTILRNMAEVHQQVLARAEIALKVVSADMRALHQRGKGILAYTDIFPKTISVMRERKG